MILLNLPILLRRRRSKWTSPVQVWTLKLCFKCNACIPQTRRSSGDATIYRGLCARRAKGEWRSTIISLVAGVIRKRQTCATLRQQMLINAG